MVSWNQSDWPGIPRIGYRDCFYWESHHSFDADLMVLYGVNVIGIGRTENIEHKDEAVDEETISKEMERRDQYKLYVSNLKNWMSQKEATQLFKEKSIPGLKLRRVVLVTSRSVKKQRGKQFAFVTFNSIEEREAARPLIECIEVEGKKLKCKDVCILVR